MLSNVDIYNPLRETVRNATHEPEFSLSQRPDFLQFVLAVQEVNEEYYGCLIDATKLKNLWYGARYFSDHWQKPTKRADRSMLWSAFMFGLSREAGIAIYLAWTTKHGRTITQAEYDKWKAQVLEPTWKEAQPRIKEHTEKIMKEKAEKTAKKLKTRILEALKEGRSTTDALAKQLGVSSKAIDGHLYRMAGSADGTKAGTGEVNRVGWGLYEIVQ
ncbi:MAG TPA: hypothetical protein VFQ91_00690 [Bryobacteraceae bacterium]|nr:hypothetical protein [Bryobacteraceae bacterium]